MSEANGKAVHELNMPEMVRNIMSDPGLSPTEARFAYHVIDSAGYGR